MNVSVVMASCNQGRYVKATCKSAIAGLRGCNTFELIVVDDKSQDRSCDKLGFSVSVIKTDTQLGCSQARRLAAERATGSVIILTDPHCLFPNRSLFKLAKMAQRHGGIWQPQVYLENKQKLIAGAQLQVESNGVRIARRTQAIAVPALLGSVYAMRRDTYYELDGYPWLPGPWGKFETLLALKAHALGVPINVHAGNVAIHMQYRQDGIWPFKVPPDSIAMNNLWVHKIVFEESYDAVWKPLLIHYHELTPQRYSAIEESFAHPMFVRQQQYLRDNAKLSEWELCQAALRVDRPECHGRIRRAMERLQQH